MTRLFLVIGFWLLAFKSIKAIYLELEWRDIILFVTKAQSRENCRLRIRRIE